MAGSVDITGKQYYPMAIGHRQLTPVNEQAPAPAPVTITGVSGLNQIVTAIIGAGWTYSSIQWRRNVSGTVSDIAGATSLTYTQQAADVVPGVTIYPALSGLVFAAPGLTAPVVQASTGFSNPLTKYIAAKARGISDPARIVINGDSNVTGEGAGGITTNTLGLEGARYLGWAPQLLADLGAETAQSFGDGNVSGLGGATPMTLAAYEPGVTLGTGWAMNGTPAFFGGQFIIASAATAGYATFPVAQACNQYSVRYIANTNGALAMDIEIDGVLVQTINCVAGAGAIAKFDFTAPLGVHTIRVRSTSTGTAVILGVTGRVTTGAKPLGFIGGACGQSTTYFAAGTNAWVNRLFIAHLNPDLFIFGSTINDMTQSLTKAAYKANVLTVIAQAPNADIVLLVCYPANVAGTTNGTLDGFRDALNEIAATDPTRIRVIDTRETFGVDNAAAAAKGYVFDAGHPNLAGHTAQKALILAKLQASGA